jgi:hypothetical protein
VHALANAMFVGACVTLASAFAVFLLLRPRRARAAATERTAALSTPMASQMRGEQ